MTEPLVREYQPGDEVGLERLFAAVFDSHRPIESWRWWYFGLPSAPSFVRVLIVESEVAGHLGKVDFPTFLGGRLGVVALSSDLAVHPDHQGQNLRLMLPAFGDGDSGYEVKMSFPTDRMVGRTARRDPDAVLPGRMTQWARWHTATAVAASRGRPIPGLLRRLIDLALHLLGPVFDRTAARLAIENEEHPGAEFDSLAAASASFATCIRRRDAAYVQWRWLDNPTGAWTVWTARHDGELVGWAVAGRRHGDPSGTGRIVDLLAPDARTLRRLLAFSAARLRDEGCDIVTFELVDPRRWARRACFTAGFLPRGIGPNIALRKMKPEMRAIAGRGDAWYLTMGDTDLV